MRQYQKEVLKGKSTMIVAALCVAGLISGTAFADEITIVNAFENPAGGFFCSGYDKQVLTNITDRTISFAALGTGEPGLREFIVQPSGNASRPDMSAATGCSTLWPRWRRAPRRPSRRST